MFLGAAPGVGTTYAMLEEGGRLMAEGRDVAIGVVETRGRPETAALLEGLEVVAPHSLTDRGRRLEEMDLDAVVARRPEVVLVDELAHTNAAGSQHEKRWEDVETLLDAGIDVLTTLDIRHLQSLTDVVHEITGVSQEETIPDQVVRGADEIELLDMTEERIRRRLAAGNIYPAERIDAALANYFRPGNLGALRQLALSWTADHVDDALARYRAIQGIEDPWETKERLVVAIAGVAGGDAVIRRAARMAMRARADLLGVFVRPAQGITDETHATLSDQRDLLAQLGGRYHEVVGDDVGEALLAFGMAENATQLVVGAFRRSRLDEWLRGSPISKIIRDSGPIDVHVVSYDGGRHPRPRLPRGKRVTIGWRRTLTAWVIALVGFPFLTWLLLHGLAGTPLHITLFIYLLAAVVVAAVGGKWPAVAAAVGGFVLANWYFTPPVRTWTIAHLEDLFSLFTFLVVSLVVGLLVGIATRKSAEAGRARAQAEALAATSAQGHPRFGSDPQGLVLRIKETFSLTGAAVLRRSPAGWESLAQAGDGDLSSPEDGTESIELTRDMVLVLRDGRLTSDDRRVLRAFAAQTTQAIERVELEREARAAETMAETERLRTALLRAVSHDLRTPLATIKASVTSLLETGVDWSAEQTRGFLATTLEETERLNRLVGRLLDASRVQAGAVPVFFRDIGVEEVVSAALAGVGSGRERVEFDIPENLSPVWTDPTLLERVVANLVENAITWSPPDAPVVVTAGEVGNRIDLRIVDRGPGIPPDQRDAIFQPFQRLGDSPSGEGVGLGLTVTKGFLEAMGNELEVEETSGGGTTMVISLEMADRATNPRTPAPIRSAS